MTWRRLFVLTRGLPADSATARIQHGESAQWVVSDYLLANVVDRVTELAWLTVEINKKKGAANPLPEPTARPGAEREPDKPKLATVTDLKRFFGGKVG